MIRVLQGNALLPPDSSNIDELRPIDLRLNKDAIKEWKRSDVLGILIAAYAMLLRASPSALSSPRLGGAASVTGGLEVRKTLRECLHLPAELKAFTFGRLSLIPAIRRPLTSADVFVSTCDIASFLLASVADFASRFLDLLSSSGECPVSRAKWEQDAEDTLRLQRSYQEQQRKFHGQFRDWAGADSDAVEPVPNSVDLLGRPDCIDDVISFSVAVCSLHHDYALRFWSHDEHIELDGNSADRTLAPSRALKDLHLQQTVDHSLRPAYVAFLAALSLAVRDDGFLNGARIVNEIFSGSSTTFAKSGEHSWGAIFETLRHYVRELNPNAYASHRSSNMEALLGMSTDSSTAYYYLDDATSTNGYKMNDKSKSNNTVLKPKELGEENTSIVLSHLTLIANVALNYPNARHIILSTYLPIRSPDQREIIGQDGALNILFTLSIMPLDPEVRGTVFKTLACLLSVDGISCDTQLAEARKVAMRGWELLEACQIIPVHVLEKQYGERQTIEGDSLGISFPPSSVSLVSLMNVR